MSPAATPPTGESAPERWIRHFVTLYLEVEACLRPVRHVRPMLAPQLEPDPSPAAPSQLPIVRTVRVQLRRGACEAVVLLAHPDRVEALALALRRDGQGWRVDEVRRPGQPRPRPQPADAAAEETMSRPAWAERVERHRGPGWTMPAGWRRRVEDPAAVETPVAAPAVADAGAADPAEAA